MDNGECREEEVRHKSELLYGFCPSNGSNFIHPGGSKIHPRRVVEPPGLPPHPRQMADMGCGHWFATEDWTVRQVRILAPVRCFGVVLPPC